MKLIDNDIQNVFYLFAKTFIRSQIFQLLRFVFVVFTEIFCDKIFIFRKRRIFVKFDNISKRNGIRVLSVRLKYRQNQID